MTEGLVPSKGRELNSVKQLSNCGSSQSLVVVQEEYGVHMVLCLLFPTVTLVKDWECIQWFLLQSFLYTKSMQLSGKIKGFHVSVTASDKKIHIYLTKKNNKIISKVPMPKCFYFKQALWYLTQQIILIDQVHLGDEGLDSPEKAALMCLSFLFSLFRFLFALPLSWDGFR